VTTLGLDQGQNRQSRWTRSHTWVDVNQKKRA